MKQLHVFIPNICVYYFQVAEVTFNFWHKLSEELYQRNKTELNDCFKPYIQRLIIALCRHCQMDPDHVSLLFSTRSTRIRETDRMGIWR